MNSKTHGKTLISIVIAMVMVLSAFVVIPWGASAQPVTPVETVTLNPSGGAFPGQLVTYTWSGVPTDLVPPVYVTVYLNGAPYSTGVATYSNGVLTGTFTMPNDQPGKVFNVSFSYKDSAQNYGVSSYTTTGTTNVYGAPVTQVTTTTNIILSVPYTVKATLSLSQNKSVKTEFTSGSGSLNGYTNTSYNVSSTGKTTIYTNSTTSGTVNVKTNFSELVAFTGEYPYQNVCVNATTLNGGTAILSLPASAKYYSNFTFSESSIKGINLYANITTTWNGMPVSFVLKGTYLGGPISSSGNYSFPGTVVAKSPSLLAKTFSGSFSASYYLVNWSIGSSNIYVNYTLSISLGGQTEDGVVSLSAQYMNSTVDKTSAPTATKGYANTTDTLTVQSGYKFQSIYINIANPGVCGTYLNNFYYGENYTGNLTFSFENFTYASSSAISSLVWYNNMSVSLLGLSNQTLRGYLNLTVKTVNYAPGVADISPVVWQFSVDSLLNLSNNYGLLLIGSGSNSSLYYIYSGSATNINNQATVKNVSLPSTFYDYIGNPNLVYLNIPYTPYTLTYYGNTATVYEKFTYNGALNLSRVFYTTKSSTVSIYSNVTNFNETLNGNLNLYVNVSSVKPVIYAINGNGFVIFNLTIKGSLSSNSTYISEEFYGNLTHNTRGINVSVINVYNYVSSGTVASTTYANFTLQNIIGSIKAAFVTSGDVKFTSSFYLDSIEITGKSNKEISPSPITLAPGSSATSPGNITGVNGFGNTTIFGWYNTTFTVAKVVPALYGISAFTGYAKIWANVSIKNVSHSLTIDPYYQGMQNVLFNVSIPSVTNTSSTTTFRASDVSQNLTLVGLGNVGYLHNFVLSGSFSVTNSLYNLTNTYSYELKVPNVSFCNTNPFINEASYSTTNLTFVSGDVPTVVNEAKTTLYAMVASPILNLTLTPLANFSLTVKFFANDSISSPDYIISGSFKGSYVTPYAVVNNTVFTFSSTATGSAKITATVEETQLVFNAQTNGITLTTNPLYVLNAGPVYVTGVSTGMYGSGTVTGTVNVEKLYPVSMDGAVLGGSLDTVGFLGNGTQYSLNVVFTSSPVSLYIDRAALEAVTSVFVMQYVSESPNTGVSPVVSNYTLVSGSGALIVSISDNSIAQIVTQTGQIVNMSINQLGATIIGLINNVNNSLMVELNTSFGKMYAQLSALNAQIASVNGNLVTLSTTLGYVNTTLNNLSPVIQSIYGNTVTISTVVGNINMNLTEFKDAIITAINNNTAEIQALNTTFTAQLSALNAQITALNGTVATIQTSLGTIQTSLNNLNAAITGVSNGIATIQTSLGTIQTSLNNLNAAITGVSNGIATIQTSLGTVQTSLNNLNARITALNGTVATIQTTLGTVQTSLSSISTTVSTTATNVNNLVGSVATIQTSLGTIQGQITDVSNGVATIKTNLGTVQTSVSDISTSVSSTSSSVGSVLVWAIVAVVVAIITLVLVLLAILQINRIAKQYKGKSEIKTPEEKKPPEGGA